MESYKNSLHAFVDVIHKKCVSIHLIFIWTTIDGTRITTTFFYILIHI